MIEAVQAGRDVCLPIVGCLGLGGGLAGAATQGVADAFFGAFASMLGDGALWLVDHVMSLATSATTISLTAGWFAKREQAMLEVMALVVLPLLMAATIGAIARQDLRRLGRIWAVALPAAVLGAFAGVVVTDYALRVADAMTQAVSSGAGADLRSTFTKAAAAALAPGIPQFVAMLASVLLIIGGVLLWLELLVRSSAVYVAVFFLPLALAGLIWPATAGMAKRMVELLVALVLSKFVVVATLTLGVGALGSGSGVDAALTGSAILLPAAFAPFVLFRMVPVVEAAALVHLEGLSRRPFRAAAQAATSVATLPANPVVAMVRQAGNASAASPPQPTPVQAMALPMRQGTYDPKAPPPPASPPSSSSNSSGPAADKASAPPAG